VKKTVTSTGCEIWVQAPLNQYNVLGYRLIGKRHVENTLFLDFSEILLTV